MRNVEIHLDRYTNIPREGDYEEVCRKCGLVNPIAVNKETCREIRQKTFDDGYKIKWRCQKGCGITDMSVEKGPNILSFWLIAECVNCGKRHDIFSRGDAARIYK